LARRAATIKAYRPALAKRGAMDRLGLARFDKANAFVTCSCVGKKSWTSGSFRGRLQAATFVGDASMDGCIDGNLNSGTMRFAIRMEGQDELTQGDMKFKMTFKTTINGQETQKELAEK